MMDCRHSWETRAYRDILEMDQVQDTGQVTLWGIPIKWVPVLEEDRDEVCDL